MDGKAMRKKIEIFKGKEKEYNSQVLTLLYENKPLSAWELADKMANVGKKISLHATLNKRMRNLEAKDYVRRKDNKWHLRVKGIIAVLSIQKEPRIWNPTWNDIFKRNAEILEEESAKKLKVSKATIREGLQVLGLNLDELKTYVTLSSMAKELMQKGIINFDIIREQTLLTTIIMETFSLEQLSSLFREKRE
jgi:hypothetical protein